jgi:neutral trehalase
MQAEVRNLLALLRTHGHVPNGARRYYLNRRRVQV